MATFPVNHDYAIEVLDQLVNEGILYEVNSYDEDEHDIRTSYVRATN